MQVWNDMLRRIRRIKGSLDPFLLDCNKKVENSLLLMYAI